MPDDPYAAYKDPYAAYQQPQQSPESAAKDENTSGGGGFLKGLAEGNPLSMREWPEPGQKIPGVGETFGMAIPNMILGGGELIRRLMSPEDRAEGIGNIIGAGAHPLGPRGESIPMTPLGPSKTWAFTKGAAQGAYNAPGARPGALTGGMLGEMVNGPKGAAIGGAIGGGVPAAIGAVKGGIQAVKELPPRITPVMRNPPQWQGLPETQPVSAPAVEPIPPATTSITGRLPGPIKLTENSRTPAWTGIQAEAPKPEPMVPITPAKASITGRAPGGLGSPAQIAAETKPLVGIPTPAEGVNIQVPEGLPSEYLENAKEGIVAQAQNRYNRIKMIMDAARSQGKDLAKMGPGQREAFARTIGSGRPLSPGTDKLLLQELAKPSKPIRTAGGEPVR